MKRWKASIVQLALASVITLSGSAMAADTVLTVGDWSDGSNTPGSYHDILVQEATAFEQAHPGVTVKIVNVGPWGDTYQKIPVMAAADSLPDAFLMLSRARTSLIQSGIIADITPFVEKDKSSIAGIVPPLVDYMQYRGRYYGLPETWNVWIGNVNLTAFSNAGLTNPVSMYNDGTWDFSHLAALAKKLTAVGQDGKLQQIGIVTNADHEVAYPWAWGYGQHVFSPDGTKAYLTSNGVQSGYQFFADLLTKDNTANIIDSPGGIGWDGFTKGKWGVAFWWDLMGSLKGDWKLPYDFDLLPFPAGPSSQVTNVIAQVNEWSIAATSPHQQLAWEWIKFVTNDAWDRTKIDKMSYLPVHMDNFNFATSNTQSPLYAPHLGLVLNSLAKSGAVFTPAYSLAITDKLTDLLNPVWLGKEPAKSALENAQTVVTQMINDAMKN